MSSGLILSAEIQFADGTEWVASEAYTSGNGDTPSNVAMRPRLFDPAFERALSFATWRGDRGVAPVIQEISVLNADGALDSWRSRTIRDREVILRVGTRVQSHVTWTVVARLTGERIELGRDAIRIVMRSKLARMDRQLTGVWPASTPATSLRSRNKPLAVGPLLYGGGVLWQDNAAVNGERYYAVNDGPIAGIDWWASTHGMEGEGWSSQAMPIDVHGVRRRSVAPWAGPDQKLCVEMDGALRMGTERLGANGLFTTWTGGEPDGWDVVALNGTVSEVAGTAQIVGDEIDITWAGTPLTVGTWYWVEMRLTGINSGAVRLKCGGVVLVTAIADQALGGAHSTEKCWRAYFQAAGTDLVINVPAATWTIANVNSVQLWDASAVTSLFTWVLWLTERCGLSILDINTTRLLAASSARPFAFSYFAEQGANALELLYRLLDSVNAGVFEDLSGRLQVIILSDPAPGSPVATITDDDLVEGLVWDDDTADGLSTSLVVGRNYVVLSEEESAPITSLPGVLDQLRREDLRVQYTGSLPAEYARSRDAAASDTLIATQAHGQTEIDARCGLYATRRFFGSMAVRWRTGFESIEPGRVVDLVSQRYGTHRFLVHRVAGTLLATTPVLQLGVWK